MKTILIALLLIAPVLSYADEEKMTREEMLLASNLWLQAQLAMERRAAIFAKHGVQVGPDGSPVGVDQDGVIHRTKPAKK